MSTGTGSSCLRVVGALVLIAIGVILVLSMMGRSLPELLKTALPALVRGRPGGYGPKVLVPAQFDWATVKSAFRFGVFEMLGSAMWAVGQSVEILITQARLVDYAEVWGNWVVAQNLVFAYQVLQSLYDNLMPSISEAISQARRVLSQYYAALAYQ